MMNKCPTGYKRVNGKCKKPTGAWNVYRDGKLMDKVFYAIHPSIDAWYVRKGLIEHDGYPSDITVKREWREI